MYNLKSGLHFHGSLEYATREQLLEIIESLELDNERLDDDSYEEEYHYWQGEAQELEEERDKLKTTIEYLERDKDGLKKELREAFYEMQEIIERGDINND